MQNNHVTDHGLALFDFDGTITRRDTFVDFIIFAIGPWLFLKGIFKLAPWILLYGLKLYRNDQLKPKFLTYFFSGMELSEFQNRARDYSIKRLPKIIKQSALDRLGWHKKENHRVCVVSASIDLWLSDWCSRYDVELISTQLEVRDGKITGRLASKNCYGMEKVNRIKEVIDLSAYSKIYAYGDSRGDREMLKLAHEPFYRTFH